jgi:hypothetical protein
MRQDHRASWRVCSLVRAAPFAFCEYGRNTCSIVTRWERMAYDYHIMTYTPLEREDGMELSVEETIHVMKRAIILGSALSVFVLVLVSCASSPEATTTTTRQTTVATPVQTPTHAPGAAEFVGTIHQGTQSHGY